VVQKWFNALFIAWNTGKQCVKAAVRLELILAIVFGVLIACLVASPIIINTKGQI